MSEAIECVIRVFCDYAPCIFCADEVSGIIIFIGGFASIGADFANDFPKIVVAIAGGIISWVFDSRGLVITIIGCAGFTV